MISSNTWWAVLRVGLLCRRGTCGGSSLDHLIRPCQQRGRDRETESFGGLEVDDELELGGLLDRQVGRLGTFQDLVHVQSSTLVQIVKLRAVGHEASNLDVLPLAIDRGQAAFACQPGEASPMRREEGTLQKQETVGAPHRLASRVKIIRPLDRHRLEPHAERARCDLRTLELDGLVRLAGCQSTATRFRLGTIALSSSRRLPAKSSEVVASPVILPPGRPRLGTIPNPTGSTTPTKTIGTDVVAFPAARAAGPAEARMTSTFERSRSSANCGSWSTLPSVTRSSTTTFWP